MKNFSFLFIVTIMFLFSYGNIEAQITTIKTIDSQAYVFLGAANMDNDPGQELVYGIQGGSYLTKLIIIDGMTGNIKWESPSDIDYILISGWTGDGGSSGNAIGYNSPFCDINNDGIKEITFYDDGKIYIVGLQGTTNSIRIINNVPNHISLKQNYPNPFNPSTTIDYEIQQENFVKIKIYNSEGQLVRTLVNERKPSGDYSVLFDGKNENGQTVSSGVYFYQLQAGDFVSNKKMIMLK